MNTKDYIVKFLLEQKIIPLLTKEFLADTYSKETGELYGFNKAEITNFNKKRTLFAEFIAGCVLGQHYYYYSEKQRYNDVFYLGSYDELKTTFGTIRKRGDVSLFDFWNDHLSLFNKKIKGSTGVSNGYSINGLFLGKLDAALKAHSFKFKKNKKDTPVHHKKYTDKTSVVINKETTKTFIKSDADPFERLTALAFLEHSNNNTVLNQFYSDKSKKTDRLNAIGLTSLQNVSKGVREALLSDYYCYDMDSAAFAILFGLAADKTIYPTIQRYIQETKTFRTEVAQQASATIKDVKLTFLMKSFGSVLNQHNGAGSKIDNLEQIKQSELFNDFINEYELLKRELIDSKRWDNKLIELKRIEAVEIKKKGSGRVNYENKFIVWLYNHYEVKALKAMQGTETDCLLLHDGIYTKTKKNPIDLESEILNQTGLFIGVSKE
ncbi:hypothetical protein VCRA2110O135_200050 [Vibrio crassostreae]|nr:hypothetical protein VCRA2110O135_200050 [Vibrio crassostreae]